MKAVQRHRGQYIRPRWAVKGAVVRLRELQPNFSICRQCEAVGIVPVVAEPLIEALRTAGLSD
jgi:hypothetical protein